MRGDVSRLVEGMRVVRRTMGLELTNGKIEAVFMPLAECGLKEQGGGG